MKVTVIITNYNKAPFLEEAIESAIRQDYKEFELLIIDDGSTDNSKLIIKSYLQHPRVKAIFQENQGVISTRNKAIRSATGEFVVQLDGDDKLAPNFLTETVLVMLANERAGIVYGEVEFFGEKKGLWDLGGYSLEKQLRTNQIVITALFKKSDFLKSGGYDMLFQNGYEDWDLWLSIISLGKEVVKIDKRLFFYRILDLSRNSSISKKDLVEIRKNLFFKHKDLYNECFINPIELANEVERLKEFETAFNNIKMTFEYKMGKLLLSPIRKLKTLFSKS